MGGDTVSVPASSSDDDDLTTVKQQFRNRFSKIATPCFRPETVENESVFRESDARSFRNSYKALEVEANDKRMRNVSAQVFKYYDELNHRIENIDAAKSKILSYTPGSWIENVGGTTMNHFDVPKTTTLLLVGPKGSGKSSLINRISRVFEDDKFAPERAQVTYNSSIGDGTSFLQEYMIPRNSSSFCLYDTRSFSDDFNENSEMIKSWMTKGVSHGEFVKRGSDSSSLSARMKYKFRQDNGLLYQKRPVNYVIFVVNGLSILKCVDSDGVDTQYTKMVAEAFNSPSLSFKDHKPAIAITHGDLLSLSERARVRVYLGELLGVHPTKQTFDIPDNSEPTTALTIVDLLRYTLEHADRNLPCKIQYTINAASFIPMLVIYLLVTLMVVTLHKIVVTERIPEANVNFKNVFAENTPEINADIRNVFTENIPAANLDMKNVFAEYIPEENADLKTEFLENIPVENVDIKKKYVENIPEENVDLKKEFVENILEENVDLKKKFEENILEEKVDLKKKYEENVVEENVDIKKEFVENIKKPISEKKKVNGERINKRSVEKKKVRGEKSENVEIDWKTIRHLW